MKYSEKLKDPRWQRRRLEVMRRDNWACKTCGNTAEELHVHHLRYQGHPWDAPDDALLTLCKSCHDAEHMPPPEREKEWWEIEIEEGEAFIFGNKLFRKEHGQDCEQVDGAGLFVSFEALSWNGDVPYGWMITKGGDIYGRCDINGEVVKWGMETEECLQALDDYIANTKDMRPQSA